MGQTLLTYAKYWFGLIGQLGVTYELICDSEGKRVRQSPDWFRFGFASDRLSAGLLNQSESVAKENQSYAQLFKTPIIKVDFLQVVIVIAP